MLQPDFRNQLSFAVLFERFFQQKPVSRCLFPIRLPDFVCDGLGYDGSSGLSGNGLHNLIAECLGGQSKTGGKKFPGQERCLCMPFLEVAEGVKRVRRREARMLNQAGFHQVLDTS